MREIPLITYVAEHGQTATAKKLGLTQGSIWQMLDAGRNVTVVEQSDGSITAYEKKPIGKPQAA